MSGVPTLDPSIQDSLNFIHTIAKISSLMLLTVRTLFLS